MYCTKCGCKLEDGASFCHNCGQPIEKESFAEEDKIETNLETENEIEPIIDQNQNNLLDSSNEASKMNTLVKIGLWMALYSWLIAIFPLVPIIGAYCSYKGKQECEEKGTKGLTAAKWGMWLNIIFAVVKTLNVLSAL